MIQIETVDLLEFDRSGSAPVLFKARDGYRYVVKDLNTRVRFNEHIVARFARLLEAPVPPCQLVDLPDLLQRSEPLLAHMTAGILHGSRYIERCGDRDTARYPDREDNRRRFAALDVLYTWMGAGDPQVIYEHAARTVWSVDHGDFFTGESVWSIDDLRSLPLPDRFDRFFDAIQLTQTDRNAALARLGMIGVVQISEIIGSTPEWDVPPEDRVVLCQYLFERRQRVIELGRG